MKPDQFDPQIKYEKLCCARSCRYGYEILCHVAGTSPLSVKFRNFSGEIVNMIVIINSSPPSAAYMRQR